MGLCKWILKRISCNSKCSYNNAEFDIDIFSLKLNDFKLKNKDMIKIGSILKRRNTKFDKEITEI